MLLIVCNVWFGPSRDCPSEMRAKMTGSDAYGTSIRTFMTRMPLPQAIRDLREYDRKFAMAFGRLTATEHSVISVQTLPAELTDEEIELARAFLIENISKGLDEDLAAEGPWWERKAP